MFLFAFLIIDVVLNAFGKTIDDYNQDLIAREGAAKMEESNYSPEVSAFFAARNTDSDTITYQKGSEIIKYDNTSPRNRAYQDYIDGEIRTGVKSLDEKALIEHGYDDKAYEEYKSAYNEIKNQVESNAKKGSIPIKTEDMIASIDSFYQI